MQNFKKELPRTIPRKIEDYNCKKVKEMTYKRLNA